MVHIPGAVVATFVSAVVAGGGLYVAPKIGSGDEIVPAHVLAEVKALRREEIRRIAELERKIERLDDRITWLERTVYAPRPQRSQLEFPEELRNQ